MSSSSLSSIASPSQEKALMSLINPLEHRRHHQLYEKALKLKTSVKKKNVNPEWNEDLTFSVSKPLEPIKLQVYDKDTFSRDDKMGDAEFDIQSFIEAVKMDLTGIPNGTIITVVKPCRQNCLAGESPIAWKDGKVIQDLVLRLRDVESGEIELQLMWVNIPGAPGF